MLSIFYFLENLLFYVSLLFQLYSLDMATDLLPVITLSPTCSSDIATDFPFSKETLAAEGKQERGGCAGGGGGGGMVVVEVVVIVVVVVCGIIPGTRHLKQQLK